MGKVIPFRTTDGYNPELVRDLLSSGESEDIDTEVSFRLTEGEAKCLCRDVCTDCEDLDGLEEFGALTA